MSEPQTLVYLAQLLDAGIPPIEASKRLEEICENDHDAIRKLNKNLILKRSLANSIHQAGYSNQVEHEIIKTTEYTGKLCEGLRFVSENITKRQQRRRQLRSRLLLPSAVLIIMMLINIVILLTANASFATIMTNVVVTIAVVILLTKLLLTITQADAGQYISIGWTIGLQNTNPLFQRYFEYYFFTLFYWQTEAGVDYVSGAKVLSTLLTAKPYHAAIAAYQQLISQGISVTTALIQTQLIKTAELQQVATTGENSGRFSQALQHYLIAEEQRLNDTSDTFFTWLPRIYYLIVIFYGASSLF